MEDNISSEDGTFFFTAMTLMAARVGEADDARLQLGKNTTNYSLNTCFSYGNCGVFVI